MGNPVDDISMLLLLYLLSTYIALPMSPVFCVGKVRENGIDGKDVGWYVEREMAGWMRVRVFVLAREGNRV